jgi:IS5 family transposase
MITEVFFIRNMQEELQSHGTARIKERGERERRKRKRKRERDIGRCCMAAFEDEEES